MDDDWILIKEEGIVSTYKNKHTGEIAEYQGDICIIDPHVKVEKLELFIEWVPEVSITKQIVRLKSIVDINTKKALLESRNSKIYSLGFFYSGIADEIIRKGLTKGLKIVYR